MFLYIACVARPVDRKERAANPKAKAALDKEWNKLINQDCWDYKSVRDWQRLLTKRYLRGRRLMLAESSTAYVLKRILNCRSLIPIASLRVESCSKDATSRTKGTTGQDSPRLRTSCPATMEAGQAADAFGLLPGHEIQVADGESAYTQAKQLGGPATWVRLPKDRWPPERIGKYRDPVVRLVLALYSHQDAGRFLE